MLGFSHSLNPAVFGGVQESGAGLKNQATESVSLVFGESRLLCYSPRGAGRAFRLEERCSVRTKPGAILAALGTRWLGPFLVDRHQFRPHLRKGANCIRLSITFQGSRSATDDGDFVNCRLQGGTDTINLFLRHLQPRREVYAVGAETITDTITFPSMLGVSFKCRQTT